MNLRMMQDEYCEKHRVYWQPVVHIADCLRGALAEVGGVECYLVAEEESL